MSEYFIVFKNLIHMIMISTVFMVVVSCDSNQEKHQKTLEEKLVDSFAQADVSVRKKVSKIVADSKEEDYSNAMNELAILSATHLNSPAQEYAIKRLMEQLRFNLEEAERADQERSE